MKAVVLGGGGLTGRCAVRDLARNERFDRILVADLDLHLAQQAASRAGGGKVTAQHLDVRNSAELASTLSHANVCVNAVQYTFNLDVMEGCLAAGVHYLDFGGLFHMTRKQLPLDARFRAAGLTAIPGLGQVPGVSNVLAAQASADLDRVDSVIIRDAWRDRTVGAPEIYFTWSPSTFLDEMQLPAIVFDEGAYNEYPPMSAGEDHDFPPPVGRTRVYRTLHSEAATLPESLASKGLRHCEWKEGGPGIEVLRTLALLGLGKTEPVPVRGVDVAPREALLAVLTREGLLGIREGINVNDWEITDVEVKGSKGGRPVTRHALARFPPKPEWGLAVTEYAVGICGAIGAEFIADGTISARGVVPPERSVPPIPFRAALHARGVATSIAPDEPPLPEWTDTRSS